MSLHKGVPLGRYPPGVSVRVSCRDCQDHRDFPMEAVMARLRARGINAEGAGIMELAAIVRTPCRRCGGVRFTTAPAWPTRPG